MAAGDRVTYLKGGHAITFTKGQKKSFDITLLGDKQLSAKFKEIEFKMQRKILVKAMRAAAKPVLSTAKAAAPRFTGLLARSIGIRNLKRKKKGTVGAAVVIRNRPEFLVKSKKGDVYFYPASTVLGTNRNRRFGWFQKSLKKNEGGCKTIMANEIRAGLEEFRK